METLKNKKILLVDDDQSIRLSLSYYFRKKCTLFRCQETAEQALELLAQEGFDIIVSDYRLPGMDGLSFFQEAHRRNLPALKVLITAFGNLEMAIAAIQVGVHDFILKPFNAHTVEQSLIRLVAKHTGQTLAESQEGLEKGRDAGMKKLHHRMNNVLQSILANADMGILELKQGNLAIKRFDNIISGIENMMELVKEIKPANTN